MAKSGEFWFQFDVERWIGGTSHLNFEERGFYLHLLLMQWKSGPMTEKAIRFHLGSYSVSVWESIQDKFEIDEQGRFYNSRMAEICKGKAERSVTNTINGNLGGRPHKDGTPANSKVKPNQNPNHNPNDNRNNNPNETDSNTFILYNSNTVNSSDSESSIISNRGMQGGIEIASERPSHEWYAALYLRFVSAYGQTGRATKRSSIEYALHSAVDDCMNQGKMNQNEAATFLSEQAKRCAELDEKAGNAKRLNPETWLNEKCYQSQIKPEAVPTEKTKQQAKQDEVQERMARVAREYFEQQKAKEARL